MAIKKELRFKGWSKGIVRDIDAVDTPADTLFNCSDFIYKQGQVVPVKKNEFYQGLDDVGNPKSAYFTYSVFGSDGGYRDVEFLYIYHDPNTDGGEVIRFWRNKGATDWAKDTSFNIACEGTAKQVSFTGIGDDVLITGIGKKGERFAKRYSFKRFSDKDNVDGWLLKNNSHPDIVVDENESTINSTLTNDEEKVGIWYSQITSNSPYYDADTQVTYYVAFKNVAGFETNPVEIVTKTDSNDFNGLKFKIKATTSLAEEWNRIILYKELNGGGKYFLGECDINKGFIADFANSGDVEESEAGWSESSGIYTTNVWVRDLAIYNQPYDYISSNHGGMKDSSEYCTTFKGRYLMVGSQVVNGTERSSLYVSAPDGIGALYKDDYLTPVKAEGLESTGVATLGNYILIFYKTKVIVLDGTHPSPAMWKEVAVFYQGVENGRAILETNSGILFANKNALFVFNGRFSDITSQINKDLWDEYINSDANEISLAYDTVEKNIYVSNKGHTLIINPNMAIAKSSQIIPRCVVRNRYDKIQYITGNSLYTVGNGESLSGTIVSNKTILESTEDKILFRVKVRGNAKATTDLSITLYFDDKSKTYTKSVNGSFEISIPLKERFKRFHYSVSGVLTLKEVSTLVGWRQYNREGQ